MVPRLMRHQIVEGREGSTHSHSLFQHLFLKSSNIPTGLEEYEIGVGTNVFEPKIIHCGIHEFLAFFHLLQAEFIKLLILHGSCCCFNCDNIGVGNPIFSEFGSNFRLCNQIANSVIRLTHRPWRKSWKQLHFLPS